MDHAAKKQGRRPAGPTRKLKTWHWSAKIRRDSALVDEGEELERWKHGRPFQAGSVDAALDAVGHDEGATNAVAFEYWPHGGWAVYHNPPSRGGGTITVVVVEGGGHG